jgi:hypothetical protein
MSSFYQLLPTPLAVRVHHTLSYVHLYQVGQGSLQYSIQRRLTVGQLD